MQLFFYQNYLRTKIRSGNHCSCFFIRLIIVLLCVVTFSAKADYRVRFNSEGGSKVEDIVLTHNSENSNCAFLYNDTKSGFCFLIMKMNEKSVDVKTFTDTIPYPTREGYSFAGWFFDKGYKFYAERRITQDTLLYARWVSATDSFTVTLNPMNGENIKNLSSKEATS